MQNLEDNLKTIVNEHGVMNVIQVLVGNFDGQADFAHMAGNKKDENNYRKVAVILFEALRKIDSL